MEVAISSGQVCALVHTKPGESRRLGSGSSNGGGGDATSNLLRWLALPALPEASESHRRQLPGLISTTFALGLARRAS